MASSKKQQASSPADTSAVKALLVRPIAFHPILARLCGSLPAGVMLSQAIYWADRTSDADGWFYKTGIEWTAETTLTRTEQESARKKLRSFDFWKEEKRGVPALLYYRVDLGLLALGLSQFAGILQPSLQESRTQDCRNPAPQFAGILQPLYGTETTTETTTEKSPLKPTSPPKPCRIPEDFKVTEEHRKWARENSLPDPRIYLDEFRDFWMAKPGTTAMKLDWDATFRTWIRRAVKDAGGRGNGMAKPEKPWGTQATEAELKQMMFGSD